LILWQIDPGKGIFKKMNSLLNIITSRTIVLKDMEKYPWNYRFPEKEFPCVILSLGDLLLYYLLVAALGNSFSESL
jgi:hypothetical protein